MLIVTPSSASDWFPAASFHALLAFSLSSSMTSFRISSMSLLWVFCARAASSAEIWKSNSWVQGEATSGWKLESLPPSVASPPGGSRGRPLSWLRARPILDCVTEESEAEQDSGSWSGMGFGRAAAGASLCSETVWATWDAACCPTGAWVTTTGTLTL